MSCAELQPRLPSSRAGWRDILAAEGTELVVESDAPAAAFGFHRFVRLRKPA